MILYYDCFAGISGDMNLAAMIDLGVKPDFLRSELSKLGLDDAFELKVHRSSRGGICGTRVDVVLHEAHEHEHESTADSDHVHAHKHAHEHSHHAHSHHAHSHQGNGKNTHTHEHGHAHHRNLQDIQAIISDSTLPEKVKATSLNIFQKVAAAEARVHGKPLNEIHFHEVGAVDSIVDIVGAAICYHQLNVESIWASPVELGGGFVHCAHGLIPVPAPATVEILHGIPTTRGRTQYETTTPTGAAILASLVDVFTDTPSMTTWQTGYGIGHRAMNIPNMLRAHLITTEKTRPSGKKADHRSLPCLGTVVEAPETTMATANRTEL